MDSLITGISENMLDILADTKIKPSAPQSFSEIKQVIHHDAS